MKRNGRADKQPAYIPAVDDPSGPASAGRLLEQSEAAVTGIEPEKALGILVATYCGYGFQVLAGIFGLLLANKKSLFTVILGVLLFIPQLITFLHVKNDITLIIVNAVILIIPYLYLSSAVKNYKA